MAMVTLNIAHQPSLLVCRTQLLLITVTILLDVSLLGHLDDVVSVVHDALAGEELPTLGAEEELLGDVDHLLVVLGDGESGQSQ